MSTDGSDQAADAPIAPADTQPAAEGEIASVTDLLTALRDSYEQSDVVWYRGHANEDWSLLASVPSSTGSPQ